VGAHVALVDPLDDGGRGEPIVGAAGGVELPVVWFDWVGFG